MATDSNELLLVTGATGFIGHYVLANLLHRGVRAAVLLRPPLAQSLPRLERLLAPLGIDLQACLNREQFVSLAGDLDGQWPELHDLAVSAILHGAASTRFHVNGTGEPLKTNIEGTRRLLEWAGQHDIRWFHLISSAYACGHATEPVPERPLQAPEQFHNDYERSKWESERLCGEWANGSGRRLTVYRPSVVVGEHATGRSTKFSGFYLPARATELLDRIFADAPALARQSISLRIKARALDCQNIVPVDYVARLITEVLIRPAWHGGVYHLTHPHPPTNQEIKQAFERHFGIGGGRFVEPEGFDATDLNDHEQQFYEVSRSIEHYFVDTPTFLRANADALERELGIACPRFDGDAIGRLVAYARSARWGRGEPQPASDAPGCAAYFERFLPRYVERSHIAAMTRLTTTMRFVIEDEPDGQWVCRFDQGRLRTVHRGSNGIQEDFGYRATRAVFWEAISGRVHPQELFLSGRAEVFGDIERALKMAMILHSFTREFPCDERRLAETVEPS